MFGLQGRKQIVARDLTLNGGASFICPIRFSRAGYREFRAEGCLQRATELVAGPGNKKPSVINQRPNWRRLPPHDRRTFMLVSAHVPGPVLISFAVIDTIPRKS